jgi:ATP-binding cassette, subfamily F, member 3
MLSVNNLSIHYSGNYLFNDVSIAVLPEDNIGLVGRNGAGKSTLLKIIKGLTIPEDGKIIFPNDYKIGYLPQELEINSEKTVYIEAESALSELKEIEEKINSLSDELTSRTDYEEDSYLKIVERLSEFNERYRILGGQSSEADIVKVLTGLGFTPKDFHRPVNEFSGGWKMRIELAKILLAKPDCLLLDEPTNHLDIESVMWLEGFLRFYPGSLIMVSHDKSFLNVVTNRTIEISKGKIYDIKGNYEKYLVIREEQRLQEQNAVKNQQKHIAQTQRFIDRFKSKASLASRAQSRVKKLEKITRLEVDLEDTSSMHFHFVDAPRSGEITVDVKELTKSYGDLLVLNKIDFQLGRGERVAFVGKNGEGKSTLSRIIAGEDSGDGTLKIGHNVVIGYYAQDQADILDPGATVFDIIDRAAQGEMRTQIRNLLGSFLFSGDSVYKKVRVLSGGEKSRLSLCRLLLQQFNLLILDEPTNHLDMLSKDVLKAALMKFNGSMIIVSHDRDFLRDLTDSTVHFKNNKLENFPGGIDEFIEKQELESLQQLEINKKAKTLVDNKPKIAKQDREEKKRIQREANRIKKKIEACEKEIESYETKIADLEEIFSKPSFYENPDEAAKLQEKYNSYKENLDTEMAKWEELSLEIEKYQ